MRRMTVVLALAASSIVAVAAVVPASAATSSKSKKAKPVKITSRCSSNVAIVVPPGQQGLTPPVDSGHEYGPITCTGAGSGVMSETFTSDDAGDLTGAFTAYFATGTVHGKYTLAQGPGQPSGTTTFFSATYVGTSKVTGGTGTFKKIAGKGTWNCSTSDGVHLVCTGKQKLTLPPPTAG